MARAKKSSSSSSSGGRGSPEAIQKRRVARKLNRFLTMQSGGAALDGRTEKRRQRILVELEKDTRKGGGGLKPIELLQRVNALLEMGERASSIRKAVRSKVFRHLTPAQAAEMIRELQAAYDYRPETYRLVGLPHEALVAAKVVAAGAPRRGRPPKSTR